MNRGRRVGTAIAAARVSLGPVPRVILGALLAAIVLATGVTRLPAHDDHDLGGPPAAQAADGEHFGGRAEHVQIVAVPKDRDLVVYVDDADRNTPVTGAEVTISGDSRTVAAAEWDAGIYHASTDWLTANGTRQITILVRMSGQEDSVSGPLTIGSVAVRDAQPAGRRSEWLRGSALAALGFGLAMIVLQPGRARWGGALLALLMAAVLLATGSSGQEQTQAAALDDGHSSPHRRADGSVFLPKETQRLLAVRTDPTRLSSEAPVREVFGRVVPDPNRSARVQAVRSGRIDPGPDGFPHLGQEIHAGQVLAYLIPTLSTFEEASLRQSLTQIERDMALLVPRADAIGPVNPNMPQSDATAGLLQELQIQSQALTQQKEAVLATLNQKIEIRAPADGVVASAAVTAGQVVAERDLLFDIVDREAARIEAWSFDPLPSEGIRTATAATEDGRTLKLAFVGRGRVLQQQAVPLLFSLAEPKAQIDIGTPVRVLLSEARQIDGVALPRAAVVRGSDNLTTVWEHTTPETFVPHVVRAVPLDADRVLVTSGIDPDMRIVTAGATFVNQVR